MHNKNIFKTNKQNKKINGHILFSSTSHQDQENFTMSLVSRQEVPGVGEKARPATLCLITLNSRT